MSQQSIDACMPPHPSHDGEHVHAMDEGIVRKVCGSHRGPGAAAPATRANNECAAPRRGLPLGRPPMRFQPKMPPGMLLRLVLLTRLLGSRGVSSSMVAPKMPPGTEGSLDRRCFCVMPAGGWRAGSGGTKSDGMGPASRYCAAASVSESRGVVAALLVKIPPSMPESTIVADARPPSPKRSSAKRWPSTPPPSMLYRARRSSTSDWLSLVPMRSIAERNWWWVSMSLPSEVSKCFRILRSTRLGPSPRLLFVSRRSMILSHATRC
mmetsp:Transcript_16112/g.54155  ORF Transcript_16112/g.54155 Transcript_16112/m.54155 type:complete len:266 (+) Transcript_16112:217-1014(+)